MKTNFQCDTILFQIHMHTILMYKRQIDRKYYCFCCIVMPLENAPIGAHTNHISNLIRAMKTRRLIFSLFISLENWIGKKKNTIALFNQHFIGVAVINVYTHTTRYICIDVLSNTM